MIRRTLGGAMLAMTIGSAVAGAQQADSAAHKEKLWTSTDTWLSAGFVVGIAVFAQYDHHIAVWSQSPEVQSSSRTSVANFFNSYGGEGVIILSLGTYGVGRIAGSRPWSEIGLRATEAVVLSSAVTGLAKGLFGRARPNVNIDDPDYFAFGKGFTDAGYTSMPSGHATASFAFAAAVTDEVNYFWPKQTWWVATLTYGSATMVGAARIYSNKHWTTDVIAGAGVGTLTGLVVTRWHRLHPNSKLDKWLLPNSVAPTKNGLAVSWSNSF